MEFLLYLFWIWPYSNTCNSPVRLSIIGYSMVLSKGRKEEEIPKECKSSFMSHIFSLCNTWSFIFSRCVTVKLKIISHMSGSMRHAVQRQELPNNMSNIGEWFLRVSRLQKVVPSLHITEHAIMLELMASRK